MLGQFALDTFVVFGVGIDLTFVLERDVLLRVFLAANGEVERAPAGRDLLSAGFDGQRNADDGQPACALFLDHQHRFALIDGGRCLSARA